MEGVDPKSLGRAIPRDPEEAPPGQKSDVTAGRDPNTRGSQALAWERRAHIAALLNDNMRVAAIARDLGVDEKTIRYHIEVMLTHWRERALQTFDERQARQLAHLERLMDIIMDCFEASLGGKKVEYSEQVGEMLHNLSKRQRRKAQGTEGKKGEPKRGAGTGKYKKYTRAENSHGDPRFLALYIELFKEQNRILGVYASDRPESEEGKVDRNLAKRPRTEILGRVRSLIQAAQLERVRQLQLAADNARPVEAVEVGRKAGVDEPKTDAGGPGTDEPGPGPDEPEA